VVLDNSMLTDVPREPMPGTTHSVRPRRWLVAGLTALILGAALLAGLRLRPAAPSVAGVPALAASPLTISPGIHLLGGLAPAAAYAVETADGLVLVDSGIEADAGSVKAQLARLGLDTARLRAILLTHAHGDHSLGARQLRTETGARIYAGRDDSSVLRDGGPPEAFFSNFVMSTKVPLHPTPVDVEVKGDEVIELGGVRFQVLATPGHTPGSTCYLMERNGLRVLFSGDVVMSLVGSQGWKPLGTYPTYLPPRFRGGARAFLASLRTLRALPVPDLVLPGHPRQDRVPQSPVLSQRRWQALLDDGIREMEDLVGRYDSDGELFLDGVPKTLLPGLYYLGDRQGGAVYALVAGSQLFLVDTPGGPGLGAFVDARLRQLGVKPAVPAAVLLTACGSEETAGLSDLITHTHAQVVASRSGLPKIRSQCPPGTVLVAAEDLPGKGWFAVKPIPLRGRGLAPVAYQLPWANKTVVFSGRIPVKGKPAMEALFSDFGHGRGNSHDYYDALLRLGDLRPDLWLPAQPADGQNAKLYDSDWEDLLAGNRKLLP
jgi:glyoxylase-like metal-dependent hydrolase (beta-lactamase superfamily II)